MILCCFPCSEVYFKLQTATKHLAIREVKADAIGKLVQVKGIVTRATEVKPMLQVATYTCDQCGAETYQPVSGYALSPCVTTMAQHCRKPLIQLQCSLRLKAALPFVNTLRCRYL